MKRNKYLAFLLLPFFVACFDDKGNYDYHGVGDIVIENVPELLECLAYADHIVVSPKVTSTMEGEIKDGNPNYEFIWRFDLKSGSIVNSNDPWGVVNPDGRKAIDTLADFPANSYIGWFTVRDKRSGLETYKMLDIKLTSSIYEGYMVLCNEGDENRVRFDMISRISADRTSAIHDILGDLGLPESQNAIQILLSPSMMSSGDEIYVCSETGTYQIDKETFKTNESYNIKNSGFNLAPEDNLVCMVELNATDFWSYYYNPYRFGVTTSGNAYAKTSSNAGAAFEDPINTSARREAPEYRVAPYIGVSMARPGNGASALFYDVDNLRFVGWKTGSADVMQTLTPLMDPDNKLFSFQTGKELVYMESTRFSGGLAYAILQGVGGDRCVCGINLGGSSFTQEAYYEHINAPEFNQATQFAFHSQYPFMFYAVKNKVYLYDLGTGTNYPLEGVKLGDGEEVTLLKFNLYQQPTFNYSNFSDEFLDKQYDLIVGSFDTNSGNIDGGKVGFYHIDRSAHTVSKFEEYDGFAKVVDIVYRERS